MSTGTQADFILRNPSRMPAPNSQVITLTQDFTLIRDERKEEKFSSVLLQGTLTACTQDFAEQKPMLPSRTFIPGLNSCLQRPLLLFSVLFLVHSTIFLAFFFFCCSCPLSNHHCHFHQTSSLVCSTSDAKQRYFSQLQKKRMFSI